MRQRNLFTLAQENLQHDTSLRGSWVVSGFDRLHLGPVSKRNDYFIDVLFHGLIQDSAVDPCSLKLSGETRILSRPFASALLWSYGTVLRDDKYVGQRSTSTSPLLHRKVSFNTDVDAIQLISRDSKDDIGELLIDTHLARESKIPTLGKFLFIRSSTTGEEYIVPCFEIFKTYYAWSRGFIHSILSVDILNPGKYIFNKTESRFDEESRTVYVRLRSHLKDNDAKIVSRLFIGQHSEFATKKLQDCFNNYILGDQQDPIQGRTNQSQGASLVSYPPVVGFEEWQCTCIQIPFKAKRFLVTQIKGCVSDWGFDYCLRTRDNPGPKTSSEDGQEGGRKAGSEYGDDGTGIPPKKRPRKPGSLEDLIPEDNDQSPSGSNNEIIVYPKNRCIHFNVPPTAEDSYLTRKQIKVRKYGPASDEKPESGSFQNGDEPPSRKSGQLETKPNTTTDEEPVDLNPISPSYYSNLIWLGRVVKTISVVHVAISDRTREINGRLFNRLPVNKSDGAWCYADEKNRVPRLVEIIQVKIDDQSVYYVEFQKRLSQPIGFVICYKVDFSDLATSEIIMLLSGFKSEKSLSNKVKKLLPESIKFTIKKHTDITFDQRNLRFYRYFKEVGMNTSSIDSYFAGKRKNAT